MHHASIPQPRPYCVPQAASPNGLYSRPVTRVRTRIGAHISSHSSSQPPQCRASACPSFYIDGSDEPCAGGGSPLAHQAGTASGRSSHDSGGTSTLRRDLGRLASASPPRPVCSDTCRNRCDYPTGSYVAARAVAVIVPQSDTARDTAATTRRSACTLKVSSTRARARIFARERAAHTRGTHSKSYRAGGRSPRSLAQCSRGWCKGARRHAAAAEATWRPSSLRP